MSGIVLGLFSNRDERQSLAVPYLRGFCGFAKGNQELLTRWHSENLRGAGAGDQDRGHRHRQVCQGRLPEEDAGSFSQGSARERQGGPKQGRLARRSLRSEQARRWRQMGLRDAVGAEGLPRSGFLWVTLRSQGHGHSERFPVTHRGS